MFRYRRYRIFLVFAFVFLFALYKFTSSEWREDALTHITFGQSDSGEGQLKWQPTPNVAQETKKLEVDIPAAKTPQPKQTPPPVYVDQSVNELEPAPTQAPYNPPSLPPQNVAQIGVGGSNKNNSNEGLWEEPFYSTPAAVHWTKPVQNFPVATESLISLPTGKAKPLPKIQFDFGQELPVAKKDRQAKLTIIRNVFKKSWKGYKEHAWLADELRPVTGGYRDPFAGWGATLVDSLDTLWIMGLKEEFEEAAKAVDQIDFTTATRYDIPMFETTIRYLGGLLAAYDISGKKYKNLLGKAVELAEVLYSAFDTPNRMPQMYYYWQPRYAGRPVRAGTKVVLAEIGSLSVEFTRLAQLTGEQKYYDAVARITDNLENYQNKTRLPGMWPTYLDASGCKPTEWTNTGPALQDQMSSDNSNGMPLSSSMQEVAVPTIQEDVHEEFSPEGNKYIPLNKPAPVILEPNGPNPTWKPEQEEEFVWDINAPGKGRTGMKKRQLDFDYNRDENDLSAASAKPDAVQQLLRCKVQGFAASSDYGAEQYTLGGLSDSTYEYLPKQFMLLGGRIEKYRTMFEQSMEVVKKKLLFRPMLPKEEDVLFSGALFVYPPRQPDGRNVHQHEPENAHLTCFAGGMFGLGAKLFDRPEDLEIAKKLTEGCVLSYNMTATGIMPEYFTAVACDNKKHCPWNQTRYDMLLDPQAEQRLENYQEALAMYNNQKAAAQAQYNKASQAHDGPTPAKIPVAGGLRDEYEASAPPEARTKTHFKRQVYDSSAVRRDSHVAFEDSPKTEMALGSGADRLPTNVQNQPSRTVPQFPAFYSPPPPLSHEEYVKNRILEDRLPPGVLAIGSATYVLRPEAIESVWYMYRITGDPYWREAGWRMFEAVNVATSTEYGNSAIDDVTKTSPVLQDNMESFWLAETLKYFYLLFETEDVVSLDDWVLNTEAHPMRREL